MHVEKRKEGKKVKYYLAHSYREGPHVYKTRKYLGADLSQVKLKERKEIAYKLITDEIKKYQIITDPIQLELSQKEIDSITRLEKKIPVEIHHLSKNQWETFTKLFTYNTNAIEGSRLEKQEVSDILDKNKWPDKPKEDIAEAYGVSQAVNYIRTNKEHISIELILKIHKLVFNNSKGFARKLRKPGQEVVVADNYGTIVHQGAPQSRVLFLLKQLVAWYDKHKKKYPGILLAAVVHNQFENIHPFADGNGRVGRILLNNILLKHNLPPINIELKNRFEYYKTLQAYEKEHDIKPTLNLFLKEYKEMKKQLGDYK